MAVSIINLTPHDLNVWDNDGNVVATIERSGVIARAAEVVEDGSTVLVAGVEVPSGTKTLTGQLIGYEPKEGENYYVSLPFAMSVAALGLPTDQLLVSLRDHRNDRGAVDGKMAIGRFSLS